MDEVKQEPVETQAEVPVEAPAEEVAAPTEEIVVPPEGAL